MKKNNRSRKLNRSRRGVEQRSVVAVFTEGRITEPQYVKVLKGIYRGVNVQIIERYAGSSPEVLVKKALDYQRNVECDEIWCLFDKNDHLDIEVEEVIQNARKNNIMTAITNPCFELWLVLHQEDQFGGYVSKKDIQKRSQTLGLTNGKHLSDTGKKLSREKYDVAKTNALRLQKLHEGNRKLWANPSSQVWKFVDRLAKLSNQSGT